MNLLVNILFLFVNLIFCLFAPQKYSFTFCQAIALLFLIQNYIMFSKLEYKNLPSFEFFFALSYFISNFVYPVFYYPINPYFNVYGYFSFNESVINYSTALAGLGYSSYVFGLCNIEKFSQNNLNDRSYFVATKPTIIILLISILAFFLYLFTGGLQHLDSVYSDDQGDLNEVGIYSYFNNVFTITTLVLATFVLRLRNNFLKFSIMLYLLCTLILIILTGSRTLVLGLGLILVVSYSRYVKRIPKFKLLLSVFAASLLMFFVMILRQDKNTSLANLIDNQTSIFDIFTDLIITTRNLYVLVDYTDTHFNAYFLSTLKDVLSPIPGSTRWLENLNIPLDIMGGAWTTFLEFGSNSKYGLGTSMVGEMYFSFGIYGVIVISLLIGLIIRVAKNRLDNIYWNIIYFLFVSHAVFYPRAFYIFQPRTIVWSLMLIYFIQLCFNYRFLVRKHLK